MQLCIFPCAVQVGEKGVAVGIDHIDELVQLSIDNVNKSADTAALLKSGRLQLVVGDGRLGYEKFAPYDAIHVGAAAPEIPKPVCGATCSVQSAFSFNVLSKIIFTDPKIPSFNHGVTTMVLE